MVSKRSVKHPIALTALAKMLDKEGFLLIDCQFHTEHLERMGGRFLSWEEYDGILKKGMMAEKHL